jgi:hypothetical protein
VLHVSVACMLVPVAHRNAFVYKLCDSQRTTIPALPLQVLATLPHHPMGVRRPTCRMAGPQATGRRHQQLTATVVCRHTRQLGLTSSRAMVAMEGTRRQCSLHRGFGRVWMCNPAAAGSRSLTGLISTD